MQPLTKHREVITEGVTESTDFAISMKDQAHIKSILRDTLYSDKILAVLREYSANAWDAHRMAGKSDLPIKVKLPTWSDPSLIIQDFGLGLSHDDVFNVFAKYGASTKRDTNEAVGMLGIGSKSGFAYSDTFTIVSRHGGKKRTYVALLDESDNDTLSLLAEEDCPVDETGITIQLAVKNEDVREFERKARDLFQHFEPRPEINCTLPELPAIRAKLTHGIIYDQEIYEYQGGQWFAVMGCVPYRVNLDQLKGPNGEALISEKFKMTSGLLTFKIGEVQINASREELKYSKFTKEALIQKFNDLLDEYVRVVLDEIEKGGGSDWQKRVSAQVLLRLGLGKKEIGELGTEHFSFGDPKTFSITNGSGRHIQSVSIDGATRLIRANGPPKRKLKGYELNHYDYLIYPRDVFVKDPSGLDVKTGSQPWSAVNAELDALIADPKLKISGIPVVDLANLPWHSSRRVTGPVVVNAKHRVSAFTMVSTSYRSREKSKNWEVAHRQPQPDDVFVIIKEFETTNVAGQGFDIRETRNQDEQIASALSLTLPTIYGYKTTTKKPLTVADITGVHYLNWRKTFLASLPMDKVKELQEEQAWSESLHRSYYDQPTQETMKVLEAELGVDHPIYVYVDKGMKAFEHDRGRHYVIEILIQLGVVVPKTAEAQQLYEQINKTYPLLSVNSLWRDRASEWRRYIRLIDMEAKFQQSVLPFTPTVTPEKVEE